MLLHERTSKIEHLIEVNRYAQAKLLTQEGLQDAPSDPTLLYYLSLLFYFEDNFEAGIETAHRGLASAPRDEDLRYVLFKHFKASKAFADAELVIIELIRDYPRAAFYFSEYAQLMLFTFHIKKARALVNEALRVEPTSQAARFTEVLLDITEGRLDESDHSLQKLIEEDPQGEQVLHLLIMQLVEKHRYRAALVLTQELLRRNPMDQDLVDLIIDLRTATHWTAVPLWPLRRLGLMGTFLLWISFIGVLLVSRHVEWENFSYVVIGYLSYCVFSWIQEPIVKRMIKARGT